MHLRHVRAPGDGKIDPIELASAPEHELRGVDVHDGDVAAKRAAQPGRTQDAADDEIPGAVDGVERHTAVDGQAVPPGKRGADHDGVGLRKEHQRVVQDCRIAIREVVLTETAVAGHVHAENQQIALAGKSRADDGFDDRSGHPHLGVFLHAFEHVLVEAGLACRDLELGRAGDAVDRVLEAREHRCIGAAHGDEHAHTHGDRRYREDGPTEMPAQVRPAHQVEQPH